MSLGLHSVQPKFYKDRIDTKTNSPSILQQPSNTREVRYTKPVLSAPSPQVPPDPSAARNILGETPQIFTSLAIQDLTSDTDRPFQPAPTFTISSMVEADHAHFNRNREQ